MTDYIRRRSAIACDICRQRKSRCDGEQPACRFCKDTGNICSYRGVARKASPSKIESDVASILVKLEGIETLLWRERSVSNDVYLQPHHAPESVFTPTEIDTEENCMEKYREFPFMILKNTCFTSMAAHVSYNMETYGYQLEQNAQTQVNSPHTQHRRRIFQRYTAEDILAAFINRVHIWDPIFDEQEFTVEYLNTTSGALSSDLRSCLSFLVSAIGSFLLEHADSTHSHQENQDNEYFKEATMILPCVMGSTTLEAVQCLFLFNVYYALRVKPYEAFEYLTAASLKMQNIVARQLDKIGDQNFEAYRRLYWSIFLHESELCVQLSLLRTGIGKDTIPLPNGHFTPRRNSSLSPGKETESVTEYATCYLLAAIMMRKKLTRSTFIIHKQHQQQGNVSYSPHAQRTPAPSFAPIVIAELEAQLDTWRQHLIPALGFSDDTLMPHAITEPPPLQTPTDMLSYYFQAQFHACKMTHYWPALYEATQLLEVSILSKDDALVAYEQYLRSYFKFVKASLAIAYQPMPHTYTISLSLFCLSLAVLHISTTNLLKEATNVMYTRISESLTGILALLRFHGLMSPSLNHYHGILAARFENWENRWK